MSPTFRTLVAAAALWSAAAAAQPPLTPVPPEPAVTTPVYTHGEVRKVDKERGRLTLRHDEIKNLQMQPMTMVFRVADPALLDGLQPGDKVRFHVERVDGAFTVLALEPAGAAPAPAPAPVPLAPAPATNAADPASAPAPLAPAPGR